MNSKFTNFTRRFYCVSFFSNVSELERSLELIILGTCMGGENYELFGLPDGLAWLWSLDGLVRFAFSGGRAD